MEHFLLVTDSAMILLTAWHLPHILPFMEPSCTSWKLASNPESLVPNLTTTRMAAQLSWRWCWELVSAWSRSNTCGQAYFKHGKILCTHLYIEIVMQIVWWWVSMPTCCTALLNLHFFFTFVENIPPILMCTRGLLKRAYRCKKETGHSCWTPHLRCMWVTSYDLRLTRLVSCAYVFSEL